MDKDNKARIRANKKWQGKALRMFSVKLNRNTDSDVLEALEKSGNMTGLVRDSIRRRLACGFHVGDDGMSEEHKVGEIFTLADGTRVKCVDWGTDRAWEQCNECMFNFGNPHGGECLPCSGKEREDAKDVVFVKEMDDGV